MTLQIGADVGPYTVLRPARREARHARSEGRRPPRVWLAEPFAGGEPVALIVDPPEAEGAGSAGTPDDPAARLRREWALSGSLRHPHLAAVHDLIESPGGAVLVTVWADRGTLGDVLRSGGRLSAGQTVTLLAGLCAALTACHERGLVHGDVNPETVLVTGDGRPLLARVGRSTAAVDSGGRAAAEPRCASPDVARGRVATAVDDVFSLGALAMQCLAGRPAWPAQDLRDVVVQSEFGQWPTVPPQEAGAELAALVDAMLDADPGARPTVREVLARLAAGVVPEPLPDVSGAVPARVTPDRGRHAEPEVAEPPPPAEPDEPWPVDDGWADGRWARWRRVVAPVLGLAILLGQAVAAGVWWAGGDRPAAAALPVAPEATSGGSASAAPPDWAAVVRELDQRRAAAFAAADPELLRAVYTVTAPGLVEDATRIRALSDGGLRVDGLLHLVAGVEPVGPVAADGVAVLAVTDALPSAPLRDADGAVVGGTAPVDRTERLVTLEPVGDGFRIASVTLGPG